MAEDEFELTVISVLKELYPDCWIIRFRAKIRHNGEGWCPDLAVVEKRFRYWFVVEVEISTHSLQKHVLPQVRAFKRGDYGEEAKITLAKQLVISTDKAGTLLAFVPRYVAVVCNVLEPIWEKALLAENVQFMAIASYDGGYANKKALLVTGSLVAGEQSLGFGRVLTSQQVIMTEINSFWQAKEYKIIDPNGSTTWACTVDSSRAWLAKKRGLIQIPEGSIVQFVLQGEDQVEIRPLRV